MEFWNSYGGTALAQIMTRVCVDKQTRTTTATKKYVDKRYLTWFKWPGKGGWAVEIGPDRDETGRRTP
jgi:hypothetical protein